ncbi:MAG: D-alanine--D-alanine ligase [Candidatus Aminicenantes bacterium]|nr:D-alanine--D-alanine ligase [Candidatus Aminicenantes bacterium]
MKILILYNLAKVVKKGTVNDLVCEKEIEIIVPLVADLLSRRGHQVNSLETDIDVWEKLKRLKCKIDLVLNLAEGFGSGNTNETAVPAILEALEIPFTGASACNMHFALDKEKTNLVLASYGVPVARHLLARHCSDLDSFSLSFPVIAKPVREDASIGITYDSVVANKEALNRRVKEMLVLYQQPVLVEEFIDGREISVGIVGNLPDLHIFPPLEFVFDETIPPLRRLRSYEYKWGGGKEEMVRAILPSTTIRRLAEYSKIAHIVTDCRDYSRMDYRVTSNGNIYLLEVNYNPGIGPNTHGLNNTLTMMASFDGYSFEDLVELITVTARKRYDQKKAFGGDGKSCASP